MLDHLPGWLRPLDHERAGTGLRRRIEGAALLALALLLIVVTVNDTSRQTIINERLKADLVAWSHYTHLKSPEPSIAQMLFGLSSMTDVVCGNLLPGAPEASTQQCTVMTGPIVDGRRAVIGGWKVPAFTPDVAHTRYGCFGSAEVRSKCRR